jgi:CRP/FNR family transcriptional regulator, cyclic AMP receptor protein
MSAAPQPEAISSSPLGRELDAQDCLLLAGAMQARRLRDGEALIEEGHSDNALYLVVSGVIAVTRVTGVGDAVTLHLLKTGDIAGEMGFVDGAPHSATLRAMGEAEVYSLTRDALEKLLDAHPRLVYIVMRAVVRTVHAILLRMNLQHVELTNYITKQHGRY